MNKQADANDTNDSSDLVERERDVPCNHYFSTVDPLLGACGTRARLRVTLGLGAIAIAGLQAATQPTNPTLTCKLCPYPEQIPHATDPDGIRYPNASSAWMQDFQKQQQYSDDAVLHE
ncbi:hypothetical protein ETB97_011358 [Aspergillus alliaceus]|uniref:Uncharacterized protein n=1 Tax=Petromyces alliaceus TaxID=209559 RepID=A0A8H6A6L1_PETAA|nr:hypothetical protein ETB97_011358 [Aspergillus burnettii]